MRIAFFGGTFDPPHRGHIAIAQAAIARLGLDRVLVAPVAAQPLKNESGRSSYQDRLAMVRLAVEGHPRLVASTADAPRPGARPNYTLDTLKEVRGTLAEDDALFCLLGADAILSFRRWHRAAELMLFCDFIVASRPGFSLEQISGMLPEGIHPLSRHYEPEFVRIDLAGASGAKSALYLLPGIEEDISATQIRAALAGGAEAQPVLAPGVADYIRAHHLYHSASGL
ncbi:MAG TPA: nicotinate (nicotinamide) nucleotide adenylyltransferase [Acidobacteriaceae bacterium]|nr:nicotinate (nicotinamide) nucleotide adenylyltransferase [Acidobacteriaceae bacterium]